MYILIFSSRCSTALWASNGRGAGFCSESPTDPTQQKGQPCTTFQGKAWRWGGGRQTLSKERQLVLRKTPSYHSSKAVGLISLVLTLISKAWRSLDRRTGERSRLDFTAGNAVTLDPAARSSTPRKLHPRRLCPQKALPSWRPTQRGLHPRRPHPLPKGRALRRAPWLDFTLCCDCLEVFGNFVFELAFCEWSGRAREYVHEQDREDGPYAGPQLFTLLAYSVHLPVSTALKLTCHAQQNSTWVQSKRVR